MGNRNMPDIKFDSKNYLKNLQIFEKDRKRKNESCNKKIISYFFLKIYTIMKNYKLVKKSKLENENENKSFDPYPMCTNTSLFYKIFLYKLSYKNNSVSKVQRSSEWLKFIGSEIFRSRGILSNRKRKMKNSRKKHRIKFKCTLKLP